MLILFTQKKDKFLDVLMEIGLGVCGEEFAIIFFFIFVLLLLILSNSISND